MRNRCNNSLKRRGKWPPYAPRARKVRPAFHPARGSQAQHHKLYAERKW